MQVKVNKEGNISIQLTKAEGKVLVEDIESSVGLPKFFGVGNTVQTLGAILVREGVDYLEEGQEVWGKLPDKSTFYNRKRDKSRKE